jgi:hypothetical protein
MKGRWLSDILRAITGSYHEPSSLDTIILVKDTDKLIKNTKLALQGLEKKEKRTSTARALLANLNQDDPEFELKLQEIQNLLKT